ncbi:MAG: type VI secretion system baseplate subunit TssG, partial [Bryobacteraceae bacterium]|nr:type VI secretion system baseplate subunit TssG [Bryobacteraceae bacterium]
MAPMASEIRPENPELTFAEVREALARTPGSFDFFQAVRLMTLAAGQERAPVGGFVPPEREVVRFVANPDLAFPAS